MSSDIRTQIEQFGSEYSGHFAQGDFDALAALHTQDATAMPPGLPPLEGRAAIRDFYAMLAQLGVKRMEFETLHVEGHGDTAVEVGAYTAKADTDTLDMGNYMNLYKRQQDGTWKLYQDVISSNQGAGA